MPAKIKLFEKKCSGLSHCQKAKPNIMISFSAAKDHPFLSYSRRLFSCPLGVPIEVPTYSHVH